MEIDANLLDIEVESGNFVAPLATELSAVLGAFERATGLHVCLRPMTDRWRDAAGGEIIRAPFGAHRSAFCSAVKAEREPLCAKCDNADLPAACAPRGERIVDAFIRTCHAGADELLLPLWSEGVLVAVLFVGQFTRGGGVPARPPLRKLNQSDIRHVRALLVALRSYLHDILRRLDGQRQMPSTGRRGDIDTYIRERLTEGPTLAGLASHLSLSRSRASHLVREATGRSFQQLVEERRIVVAKDLLVSTHGTIAWVALQIGLTDVAYFCRYFKRKTGVTPTSFRQQHRETIAV